MGESGKVKWVDERKVFVRSLATKLNQKALSKRAPRRATGELIALEKVVPVVPSECVCVCARLCARRYAFRLRSVCKVQAKLNYKKGAAKKNTKMAMIIMALMFRGGGA